MSRLSECNYPYRIARVKHTLWAYGLSWQR